MAELLPATQAAVSAWKAEDTYNFPMDGLAAFAEALAEHMPSDYPNCINELPESAQRWYRLGYGAAVNTDRTFLSAIAAELRGTPPTEAP